LLLCEENAKSRRSGPNPGHRAPLCSLPAQALQRSHISATTSAIDSRRPVLSRTPLTRPVVGLVFPRWLSVATTSDPHASQVHEQSHQLTMSVTRVKQAGRVFGSLAPMSVTTAPTTEATKARSGPRLGNPPFRTAIETAAVVHFIVSVRHMSPKRRPGRHPPAPGVSEELCWMETPSELSE
jgi:hypothetical protein